MGWCLVIICAPKGMLGQMDSVVLQTLRVR